MQEWIDDMKKTGDLALALAVVILVALVWFGFGVLMGYALWAGA